MIENLGGVLIGVAAIVIIAAGVALARRIFSGSMVPLDIKKLLEAKDDEITLLTQRNAKLDDERFNEKDQMRQMIKNATEANFAIWTFLDRYEQAGGFVGQAAAEAKQRIKRPDTE